MLCRAVEQPTYETECKHVLAAECCFHVEAELCRRLLHHGRNRYGEKLLRRKPQLGHEVFRGNFCFLQIRCHERVRVDNNNGVPSYVRPVNFESGRVHGHENVSQIAGSTHQVSSDVHLKSGYSAQCPLWSTNFCRIVRESGNGVAKHRRKVGEYRSGQLHPISGVAAESDYNIFQRFYGSFFRHSILSLIRWILPECDEPYQIIFR